MAVGGWRGDRKGCSGKGKNTGPIANGNTTSKEKRIVQLSGLRSVRKL